MQMTGNYTAPRPRQPDASGWAFLLLLLRMLSWRFVGLVLLTLAVGLVSGISLVLLMPMMQVAGLEVGGGTGERLVEIVFGGLQAVGLEPNLLTVLLLNSAAVIVTAGLARFQSIVSTETHQLVVRRLRERLYRSICNAEWLYISGERSTRFTHVLLGELDRVGAAVSALVSLLVGAGKVLAYTAVALVLSPAMTLLTAGCGAMLSLLLLQQTRSGRTAGEAVSAAYEQLYAATGEHLAALKFTKSHALEERQGEAFQQVTRTVARTHVEVVRKQASLSFWLQSGTVIALSVVIYVAFSVLSLPLATVLLLIYLFSRLLPMITGVQKSYQSLLTLLPGFSRFLTTLGDSSAAREARDLDRKEFRLERGVRLREITFGYRSDGSRTLDGLDLSLEAGKTTALVGPSGAGKSTIADLVIGLLGPDRGEVLIDDEPLVAAQRRSWRENVAYVSQEVFLFHDTIRSNLLMARPTASDEELWEALETASAGFVAALPDGLETVVGDRGMRLSGGERQRLVLARALLRRPALLVLDEATSSLDAENEERIKEAIDRLRGRVTILVIAHRLASIRSADVIHLLESGRIVESGTWHSLLAQDGGQFRALARSQGLRAPQPEFSVAPKAGFPTG